MTSTTVENSRRITRLLLSTAGSATYVAAIITLVLTGHTDLRYSADSDDTVALWVAWAPVLGGLAVAWLIPPKRPVAALLPPDSPTNTRQAWWLVGLGLAFTIGYYFSPRDDWWFLGLKLALLLAIPLLARIVRWQEWYRTGTHGGWLRPAAAAFTYLALTTLLGPGFTGTPPGPVVILLVFLFNAVLEEIFYRCWLQTRLEARYGRWPAIMLTAILWSSWHIAIHDAYGVGIDLATAIAGVGADGLFLGYLWSRYRNPWLLLLVHGVINAPVAMFVAMG